MSRTKTSSRSIKEADKSHRAGKPFFHLVMTTSNHRPFTYPSGVIDILSKTSRLGGVKYADYAVGRLVEEARPKPWFKDTVFVFVADHTAGTSGKVELDPTRNQIPLIFYSPDFITPGTHDRLASQFDVAPVLLRVLNTSYVSRFYGRDVLNDTEAEPRAFIGIYQKVALVRGDTRLDLGGDLSRVEQKQELSGGGRHAGRCRRLLSICLRVAPSFAPRRYAVSG